MTPCKGCYLQSCVLYGCQRGEEDRPAKDANGALSSQVGGQHYKDMAIQPVEFIHANNIGYLEGNVLKYIVRHKAKNGEQDVRKALHYCQLILKMQYGKDE